MSNQKRAAAIHDISCFGRCSLTVALPILSAAGIETAVLPTAVLSTHTGGFTGFTYRDLTEDIVPVYQHWQSLGLRFDALYSGFLGSFEQIEIMKGLFAALKIQDTLILVDPVMADNGKLYGIFPNTFPAGMASLCACADIIVPNLTEACLMLGRNYEDGPYTREYIETLLKELSQKLGPKKIVLTGVFFDAQELGAACYDAGSGEIDYAFSKRIDGYYHGTGDVFGSALLGALLNGKTLPQSCKIAVDFVCGAIERTAKAKTDIRFGVDFENGIADFAHQVKD
jgi:pyridoxine kinase